MTDIKRQTFGVEIEMNGITRENASKVAGKFFGTFNSYYTGNGYSTWTAVDAQGRKWNFMRDGSIVANSDAEKCELVTPVLGWDDIELLQGLVRELRANGAKAHSSCGIHVHVGADEHTPATLVNLMNLVYTHYDLLEKALKFTARREWCEKAKQTLMVQLNKKKPADMDELAGDWYGYEGYNYDKHAYEWRQATQNNVEHSKHEHYHGSRYQLVNLHSYFQNKGVEFRAFNSTLHAGEIKAYVQFCCALNSKAINMSKSSMKDLDNNRSDKHEMKHWLKLLGMNGKDAEFKTCRLHMTKNLAD